MADLVLEHLRALRDGQNNIRDDLKEVKHRLTSLESLVSATRRDSTHQQEEVYRQQASVDRLCERIDRIERRLDLRD